MKKERQPSRARPAPLPVVYLSGPMAGCNDAQQKEWRQRIRTRFAKRFEFVDPTDSPISPSGAASRFEIARKDALAIREADAVLANMWKESIGTALGVVEARRAGKIVVVVDRNHIQSTFLAYFADAVAQTEDEAMERVGALLDAQRRIEFVVKGDAQTLEPFSREKLTRAVRIACSAARRNDVLCTSEIIPRVMSALLSHASLKDGRIPSSAIRNVSLAAIEQMEGDPVRGAEFAGIRDSWLKFVDGKRARSDKGRIELLHEAYEGTDWRRRIAAELELTGQCPMNALYLCTRFEESWTSLGRAMDLIDEAPDATTKDLGNIVFHSIGLAATELRRRRSIPQSLPLMPLLLTEARHARNSIVHGGAFGGEEARRVLEAWESLELVQKALELHPDVARVSHRRTERRSR